MPWIMPCLLSAWKDDAGVMQAAVTAAQLTMPYLACMTIASLLSGVLNTSGRFALSAGVPVFLNLCTLAPLLAPSFIDISQSDPALRGLHGGQRLRRDPGGPVVVGRAAAGHPSEAVPAPDDRQGVARTLKLAIPGVLAGGALQIELCGQPAADRL